MRESKGKAISRNVFYLECLPRWLSEEQLRQGNFLVLLGDEPREIPLLDQLGAPRSHVWSVERVYSVYRKQMEQELGVSLYYEEVAEYLERLLHSNQGFLVLNLDVEGSYLCQLDKAMTSVLLYCWRNQDTVIATYSTIGRDTETLWEGVKSLVFFAWLCPEVTLETVVTLKELYQQAGFTEPLNMVLRDYFWMRSVFEHSLISSAMVGVIPQSSVQRVFRLADAVWEEMAARKKAPLYLRDLLPGSSNHDRETFLAQDIRVGIKVRNIQNVVYNSQRPWSVRCYYVKFEALWTPVEIWKWYCDMCALMLGSEMTYINHEGTRKQLASKIIKFKTGEHGRLTILAAKDIYKKFKPRRLNPSPVVPHLVGISRVATKATRPIANIKEEDDMPNAKKAPPRAATLAENGELTSYGKEMLRKIATGSITVAELVALLPEFGTVAERKVRAALAVARRK